jgi:hypothetical protein
MVCFS